MFNNASPYSASELREKLLSLATFYRAEPEIVNKLLGSLYLFLDDYVELGLEKDRFNIVAGTDFSNGEDSFIGFAREAGLSQTTTSRFMKSLEAFPEGMKGAKIRFLPRKKIQAHFFKRILSPKANVLNFLRDLGVHAKALNQLHRRINHDGEICGLNFYDSSYDLGITVVSIDDISRHFPDLRDEKEVPGIAYHRLQSDSLYTTAKQFTDKKPVDRLPQIHAKWKKIINLCNRTFEVDLPRCLGKLHSPEAASQLKMYLEICGESQRASLEGHLGTGKDIEVLKGLPFLAGR